MYGPMYSREIIFHYRKIKYKSLSKAGKLLYVTGSQKISCLISFIYLYILIVLNSFLKNQSIRVNFRELEKQRQITCKSKFQRDFFLGNNSRNQHRHFGRRCGSGFCKRGRQGFYGGKTIPAKLTVLSPYTDKEDEKMCCIFQAQPWNLNQKQTPFQRRNSKLL